MLSSTSKKPKVGTTTTIHLNAGMSKRIVDFVEKTYPKTVIYWESIGDYSALVIDSSVSDKDKRDIINQIQSMYPLEIEDSTN